MINDGTYTVVYNSGEYRTLRVKDWNDKTIIGYLSGQDNENDFTYVGFLTESNTVNFWKKIGLTKSLKWLQRFERAVQIIAGNPSEAGLAYALKSSRCYRCNRKLTVPASIHQGLGPDCATKI